MKKLRLCLLAIFTLLCSCKKSTVLEFEKLDSQRTLYTAQSKGMPVNEACVLDIQLLFPINFPNKEVLAFVQREILTQAFDSANVSSLSMLEVENNFVESIKASLKNDSITCQDTCSINSIILYSDASVLSYELDKRKSGEESTIFLIFDLVNGKRVSLNDIFADGFEPAISEMIIQQIILDNHFENEEDMTNNGYFFSENIVPNNNFSLNENGISFMYNTYEIAAHAIGQTEVTLSFEKVKPYLKKESIVSVFFEREKNK